MTALAGLRPLVLLVGRLDRVRLVAWTVVLGLLPLAIGATFAELYATEASRAELVSTLSGATAFTAVLGPIQGTSVGALVAWRIGTVGALMVAFMASFEVVRHTRADEEAGRAELVGAAVVGRHAPLAAAVLAATATGVVIGILVTVGLLLVGEAAAGSVALGLSWLLTALLFAAVGAVAAQVSESARGARLLAGGLIGLAFALRMLGDGFADDGLGWLSWASPIGWVTNVRAFAGERWWVLALFVVAAGAVLVLAVALERGRDLGAGLTTTRPGPGSASPGLGSVHGLSRRLHARSLVGWAVGIGAFAGLWGVLADTVGALLDGNPQLASIVASVGGEGVLEDAFFATAFSLLAIAVSAYSISVVLRLRDEEEEGRAESLLATPTARLDWASSHLLYAFVGPALLLAVSAVAAAAAFAAVGGDTGGLLARVVERAGVQVPAVWVVAGAAVALVGLRPRWSTWSWAVLVTALLLSLLGEVLQLPQWLMDVSPFTHVPVPPDEVTVLPLLALTVVAAALTVAGLRGLRVRDLG